VRCVYDEWYWEGMKDGDNNDLSTVNESTFTWGDIAR
jgi:hypothetical protein